MTKKYLGFGIREVETTKGLFNRKVKQEQFCNLQTGADNFAEAQQTLCDNMANLMWSLDLFFLVTKGREKMKYWLTSKSKKRHQRAMNRLVRSFNKALEQDDLWCGRFVIRQVYAPQWYRYEDGSGAEYFVHLKFIDRCTGRYYIAADQVNCWRGLCANGYKLWEKINWLITEHWDIWDEPLAKERRMDEWREYNRTVRKV